MAIYITTLNSYIYTPYLIIVILCTTQFDTLHLSNIGAPTNHTLTIFAGIEMRCSVLVFAVCYVVNVYSVGMYNATVYNYRFLTHVSCLYNNVHPHMNLAFWP